MLQIDSAGGLKNIRVRANASLFEDTVKSALRNIKWLPAKRKSKNISDSVEFSIHFDSRNLGERFIIIDGKQ